MKNIEKFDSDEHEKIPQKDGGGFVTKEAAQHFKKAKEEAMDIMLAREEEIKKGLGGKEMIKKRLAELNENPITAQDILKEEAQRINWYLEFGAENLNEAIEYADSSLYLDWVRKQFPNPKDTIDISNFIHKQGRDDILKNTFESACKSFNIGAGSLHSCRGCSLDGYGKRLFQYHWPINHGDGAVKILNLLKKTETSPNLCESTAFMKNDVNDKVCWMINGVFNILERNDERGSVEAKNRFNRSTISRDYPVTTEDKKKAIDLILEGGYRSVLDQARKSSDADLMIPRIENIILSVHGDENEQWVIKNLFKKQETISEPLAAESINLLLSSKLLSAKEKQDVVKKNFEVMIQSKRLRDLPNFFDVLVEKKIVPQDLSAIMDKLRNIYHETYTHFSFRYIEESIEKNSELLQTIGMPKREDLDRGFAVESLKNTAGSKVYLDGELISVFFDAQFSEKPSGGGVIAWKVSEMIDYDHIVKGAQTRYRILAWKNGMKEPKEIFEDHAYSSERSLGISEPEVNDKGEVIFDHIVDGKVSKKRIVLH